jgi:hypothetical protein
MSTLALVASAPPSRSRLYDPPVDDPRDRRPSDIIEIGGGADTTS